ncbi:MAG: glycoside hydrolase family 15 protein [Methylovirgula sp.]
MTGHSADSDRPLAIEDYGLIGDCSTAALVGRNGSIDWLCWPRFDAAACFAALLGGTKNGRWSITAADSVVNASRSYRGDTMVLETVFATTEGAFAVLDFMPIGQAHSSVIRIVEGRKGNVRIGMNITLRFDYGASVPWVTRLPEGGGIVAIAGPNLAVLRTPAKIRGKDFSTSAHFTVGAGERVPFVLTYGRSHLETPHPVDADAALDETERFWRAWAAKCTYQGEQREAVLRSLLTLKAQTFAATGGIVAAPTTSLPEQLGGSRNWDYRFCWLRDASLTLAALMGAGYYDEASAWRNWLRRAVAGTPSDFQIMYGVAGERWLSELKVPWLSGYQGASPVRIGNAASEQLQLDVFGEVADTLHLAREGEICPRATDWALQCKAIEHLEKIWREPDDGIWEIRGGRKNFTHSKVMAWVAFDRSIRDAEKFGLEAPLERWHATRDEIHNTVCVRAYDPTRNTFTQSFGSPDLDASLLVIPEVGFLPIDDARVAGTIAAIERELLVDGFVLRYRTDNLVDGLPSGEGVFLPCSFWLADAYQRQGRAAEANALLHRLLSLRNDLGLLSEEYDTKAGRQVGNFPQALSHLAMVRTVLSQDARAPLRERIETPAEAKTGCG